MVWLLHNVGAAISDNLVRLLLNVGAAMHIGRQAALLNIGAVVWCPSHLGAFVAWGPYSHWRSRSALDVRTRSASQRQRA